MRTVLVLAVVTAAQAQDAPLVANPAPRYNVLLNERFFPQTSPKATLQSVIRAADLGQYDTIAAYLMDEAAADKAAGERGDAAYGQVERDLRDVRAGERRDPFRPLPEGAVPRDPDAFKERAKAEATRRGFDQLVREVAERFREDPSHIRELQKYVRDGEVKVADATATITLKGDPKVMHFKLVGKRWCLEDKTSP